MTETVDFKFTSVKITTSGFVIIGDSSGNLTFFNNVKLKSLMILIGK